MLYINRLLDALARKFDVFTKFAQLFKREIVKLPEPLNIGKVTASSHLEKYFLKCSKFIQPTFAVL